MKGARAPAAKHLPDVERHALQAAEVYFLGLRRLEAEYGRFQPDPAAFNALAGAAEKLLAVLDRFFLDDHDNRECLFSFLQDDRLPLRPKSDHAAQLDALPGLLEGLARAKVLA